MSAQIASLSLDLDNKWAYLRTHGSPSWQDYPSYLGEVTPRITDWLAQHAISATVFVVGRDLDRGENREAILQLASGGHEIANHSQNHYPWLGQLSQPEIAEEIDAAHEAIATLVGTAPVGFRAPGFSWSNDLLHHLDRRGYEYDSTMFPTVIGPAARLYSKLRLGSNSAGAANQPTQSYATLADAFRTLRPHRIKQYGSTLTEVPITTMPLFRVPIHVTYLTYLQQFSPSVAKAYLSTAISLCRFRRVAPVMLLHPLDFLGGDEHPDLAFFPGMRLRYEQKLPLLDRLADMIQSHWQVGTVSEQTTAARVSSSLSSTQMSSQTVEPSKAGVA